MTGGTQWQVGAQWEGDSGQENGQGLQRVVFGKIGGPQIGRPRFRGAYRSKRGWDHKNRMNSPCGCRLLAGHGHVSFLSFCGGEDLRKWNPLRLSIGLSADDMWDVHLAAWVSSHHLP